MIGEYNWVINSPNFLTMILNIKATKTTLTPSLREYVDKKLAPLEKLIGGDADSAAVKVEIGRTTNHHKKGEVYRAEIKIALGKKDLYAEAGDEDIYAAIDAAKDEIVREFKTFKAKTSDKKKAGGRVAKKLIKG